MQKMMLEIIMMSHQMCMNSRTSRYADLLAKMQQQVKNDNLQAQQLANNDHRFGILSRQPNKFVPGASNVVDYVQWQKVINHIASKKTSMTTINTLKPSCPKWDLLKKLTPRTSFICLKGRKHFHANGFTR